MMMFGPLRPLPAALPMRFFRQGGEGAFVADVGSLRAGVGAGNEVGQRQGAPRRVADAADIHRRVAGHGAVGGRGGSAVAGRAGLHGGRRAAVAGQRALGEGEGAAVLIE